MHAFLAGLTLCTLSGGSASSGAQDLEVVDLAPHAIELRTSDPYDRDFADLEPLIDAIGDARIVVLGEATHSEGTTSAMKARLAIFLHERMGFDVLAWEAGLLDCAAMDRALRDPETELRTAAQQMMRGGWDACEGVWPLFEHARASWSTARPLRMAGFDGERPPHGARHFLEAVEASHDVGAVALDPEQRSRLEAYASRAFGYISSDTGPIDPERHAAELGAVQALEAALDGPAASMRMSPVDRGRLLASIRQSYASDERRQREPGDATPWEHPRDPQMARSFRWLASGEFAGRRIIVWAATAHLTRHTQTLVPIDRDWDYSEVEHMGDTVYRDFAEQLYTIALTSHHGTLGTTFPAGLGREDRTSAIELPPAGSFEDAAHALGSALLFVDLRGRSPDQALGGAFVARPLGLIPTRAVWRDVIDAFLFIDEMEPERYRP
jgi:erythromycin esterase